MSSTNVFEEDVMGLITISLIDKSKFKFTFKSTTTSPVRSLFLLLRVG